MNDFFVQMVLLCRVIPSEVEIKFNTINVLIFFNVFYLFSGHIGQFSSFDAFL